MQITKQLAIFLDNRPGTQESMTKVLLARVREVMAQFPFPRAPKPKDTTLLIAGPVRSRMKIRAGRLTGRWS